MGITVKNVLSLDIFKNSTILAGHKGLDRIIHRVSVFDCPIEVNRDKLVLKEGDFFISNFFSFKDDEEYASYALDFINSCGCSCFCITNEYIDYFSPKLIETCNSIDFPIITIDYTTSYGDIMTSIMELILEDQRNMILDMKISSILNGNLPLPEIKNILNYINPHFSNFLTAIYCYSNDSDYKFDKNLINILSKNKKHTCFPYKDGLLILISYSDSISNLNFNLDFIISELKNNVKNYVIGMSNNFIDINLCKNAINQALICITANNEFTNTIISYSELGIYSLLLSFKDFDELKELYASIIYPIQLHDKKNKSNLLETLISFVDNDGDYKKVSKQLFQHENTVRYRVFKIKSLLNLEKSNVEFFEKISLGVKLHKIYSNNLYIK